MKTLKAIRSNGVAPASVPTKNDLPESVRRRVSELLNKRLATAIDLGLQCKQAHWNVKGPHFFALHKLFDDVHAAAEEYVDQIAERIIQLGGLAVGTTRHVTAGTELSEYPLSIHSGEEHVEAVSSSLAAFGRSIRESIEKAEEMGDLGTADLLTEISLGTDKWLWFVEAHQQGGR